MFRRDLVRWQQLVTPRWLAAAIGGEPVVAAPAADWRLFEVGCGSAELFLSGHIPSAGYIDTNQLEQEPLWNKVSDQALLQFLLSNGIRHDTSVVLYGRNSLTAARAAHLMLYAGVTDVRLLDGGLAAWRGAGLPLVQFPGRAEYLIDMHQRVRRRLVRMEPRSAQPGRVPRGFRHFCWGIGVNHRSAARFHWLFEIYCTQYIFTVRRPALRNFTCEVADSSLKIACWIRRSAGGWKFRLRPPIKKWRLVPGRLASAPVECRHCLSVFCKS